MDKIFHLLFAAIIYILLKYNLIHQLKKIFLFELQNYQTFLIGLIRIIKFLQKSIENIPPNNYKMYIYWWNTGTKLIIIPIFSFKTKQKKC